MSFFQHFSFENIQFTLLLLSALLHIIFAGAVARDAGQRTKAKQPLILVSGMTWAFAVLLGGVVTVAIYWVLHNLPKTLQDAKISTWRS